MNYKDSVRKCGAKSATAVKVLVIQMAYLEFEGALPDLGAGGLGPWVLVFEGFTLPFVFPSWSGLDLGFFFFIVFLI